MSQEELKLGTLMILRATQMVAIVRSTNDHVPWFNNERSIQPDGFLPHGTPVVIVEPGPFFHKCKSAVGVVFFRIENLEKAP